MKPTKSYIQNMIDPIVEASLSDTWEKAIQEWDISDYDEDESASTECRCGHEGIKYLFYIQNRNTKHSFGPIGSECIKKFGRSDLSSEADVREQVLRLRSAIRSDRFVKLDSTYFSRKLLTYLFEQGAFKPSKYNRNDGENDYRFMLEMFNKRNKNEILERDRKKINGIFMGSIRPFFLNGQHV